jgi:hypothetical protein
VTAPEKGLSKVVDVGGRELPGGAFERGLTAFEVLLESAKMGLTIGTGFAGMMLFMALLEATRGRDLGSGWTTAVLPAVLVGLSCAFVVSAVACVLNVLLGTKVVRPELDG